MSRLAAIRDLNKYECPWCGNSIPHMSFNNVQQMFRSYQAAVGHKALYAIQCETGIPRQTLYWWLKRDPKSKINPGYDSVVKLAQYLKKGIRNLSKEQREKFLKLYPKAS